MESNTKPRVDGNNDQVPLWPGCKIRLGADVPGDLAPILAEAFGEWAGLIPGWCNRVNLYYSANSPDVDEVAHINIQTDYRTAGITVRGSWLEYGPGNRREAAAHEIAHIFCEPIFCLVNDIIKEFAPESAVKFLKSELRRRGEMVVCDLAHALCTVVPARAAEGLGRGGPPDGQ